MANDEKSGEVITITDTLSFCEYISSYYKEKTFSDVDIILNGEKIPSHKVILAARSKHFQSLLNADPQQSQIVVADVSSKVFLKILNYIYTGYMTLETSDLDTIFDIINLVGKYLLKSLSETINEKLTDSIDMDNVFEILNKANLYDFEKLKNVCLSFMDDHSTEVLQSRNINTLTQKSMVELLKRDSFVEPELEIFKCAAKWCNVNQDVDNLVMQTVRLNCLTIKEILTIVRPTKLVDEGKIVNVLTEIADGMPKTAKPRGSIRNEENICSLKYQPEFIFGNNTDILLSQEKNLESYSYHNIGDKNGITVRLKYSYVVNNICMKLWDNGSNYFRNYYSYYIEVSKDSKQWTKVLDYSTYHCQLLQNVYFEKNKVKYIRVVGTSSIDKVP